MCWSTISRKGSSTTGSRSGRRRSTKDSGRCGMAVRVDHLVPAQVEALFARVRADHGRLDVLVNDSSEGELHDWQPFWKVSLDKGFRALRQGVHSRIITSHYAAPLMIERRRGLIVEVGDGDTLGYRQ